MEDNFEEPQDQLSRDEFPAPSTPNTALAIILFIVGLPVGFFVIGFGVVTIMEPLVLKLIHPQRLGFYILTGSIVALMVVFAVMSVRKTPPQHGVAGLFLGVAVGIGLFALLLGNCYSADY